MMKKMAKLFCLLLSGVYLAECFPMTTSPMVDQSQEDGTIKGTLEPVLPTLTVPAVVASTAAVDRSMNQDLKLLYMMADAAVQAWNEMHLEKAESTRPSPSIHPDIMLTDAPKDPPLVATAQDPFLNLGTVEGTPLFATAFEPVSQPLLNDEYNFDVFGNILNDDTMNANPVVKPRIKDSIWFSQYRPILPLPPWRGPTQLGPVLSPYQEYQTALTHMQQLTKEMIQLYKLYAAQQQEFDTWFVIGKQLISMFGKQLLSRPPTQPPFNQANDERFDVSGNILNDDTINSDSAVKPSTNHPILFRQSRPTLPLQPLLDSSQLDPALSPQQKYQTALTHMQHLSREIEKTERVYALKEEQLCEWTVIKSRLISMFGKQVFSQPRSTLIHKPTGFSASTAGSKIGTRSSSPLFIPNNGLNAASTSVAPLKKSRQQSSSSSSITSLKKNAEKKSGTSSSKRTRKATSSASAASKKSKTTTKE